MALGCQGFSLTIFAFVVSQRRCLLVYCILFPVRSYLHSPKRKDAAKVRKPLPCNISFSGSTGSFEGERCGEGEQANTAAHYPKRDSCPLLVNLFFGDVRQHKINGIFNFLYGRPRYRIIVDTLNFISRFHSRSAGRQCRAEIPI